MTLNDRIAKAKGWTRNKTIAKNYPFRCGLEPVFGVQWYNPQGKPTMRPDFTGTVEGLAGLMREMAEAGRYCSWGYDIHRRMYNCIEDTEFFDDELMAESPPDRPGDCVGEGYLSVKKAGDAM